MTTRRKPARPRQSIAVAVVLLLASTACGSTVQVGVNGQPVPGAQTGLPLAQTPTGATGFDDGLGLPPAAATTPSGGSTYTGTTAGSSGVPVAGGPTLEGQTAAGPVGDGTTAPAATAPPPNSQPGPTRSGSRRDPTPGLSATEITIGFAYSENANALNDAAGLEGASRGDQRGYSEVMLKWVNSHGGVFGRKVVPVYHVYDGADTRPFPQQEQETCATFTEDNEVFAVAALGEPTLVSCLHEAGIPQFSVQGMRSSQEDILAQFPWYFEVTNLELNTVTRAQIEGLYGQDYFEPRSAAETDIKIGLVRYDAVGFTRAAREGMIPALQSRGLKLDAEARITTPQGADGYGPVGSQISNAILRFQREGINRVMFMESSGDLALFWMNAAESQRYFPRYGLTSNDAGEILADNVPHSQLVDSLGIGWSPGSDTAGTNALPAWPAREQCRKIFSDAGYTFADLNSEGVAMQYCDNMWFLQAASASSPSGATRQGIVAGAARLGRSYSSASGNGDTLFSPGRHFGISTYRTVAWFTDCDCFKYTNGARPYPTPR